MEKLLSIIIPTYNKVILLEKCLTSVLNHKWDDILEVIVVNDGSTDNSLEIAQKYQREFPDILKILDKENGNYGSTINAALPIVQGKYVRILDADDWFDEIGFHKYLTELANIDADLIMTHLMYEYTSGKLKAICYYKWEYNKVYQFDEVAGDETFKDMFMHAVTYRTNLLRENGYKQTEGVSYTDNEWVFYPMFYVKSVVFINALVYHYVMGLEGQTMSPEMYVKNIPHTQEFCKRMINNYAKFIITNNEKNRREYLFFRLKWFIYPLYKIYLLLQSDEEFNPNLVDDLDITIKKADPLLYKEFAQFYIGHTFHFRYITYWRRFHIRMPKICLRHWKKTGRLKIFPI